MQPKLLLRSFLVLLSFACFTEISFSQEEVYFEYLDHIEKRSMFNMLPISEYRSYVWTGTELLNVGPDTTYSLYELPFNYFAIMNYYTFDNDTTFLIGPIADYDVVVPRFIELKIGEKVLSEIVYSIPSEVPELLGVSSFIPYRNDGYIFTVGNAMYHINTQNILSIINDGLVEFKNRVLLRNNEGDVFVFENDETIYQLVDSSLMNLTTIEKNSNQILISNEKKAYVLYNHKIDIIDLESDTILNTLQLDIQFGEASHFDVNDTYEQFYVSSTAVDSYINKYTINGAFETLYIEDIASYEFNEVVVQNGLVYSAGKVELSGHYKVQRDKFIEADNRHDLALESLDVFYNRRDTVLAGGGGFYNPEVFDIYNYDIDIRNNGFDTAKIFSTFSSIIDTKIKYFSEFDVRVEGNYREALLPGNTLEFNEIFGTTNLKMNSFTVTIEGAEFMPDSDYSDNSLTDISFPLINSTQTIFEDSSISVFPNPVEENLKFDSEIPVHAIAVYNTEGKLQYAHQQRGAFAEVSFGHLPIGTYFVQFFNQSNKALAVKKINKQ